MVVFAAGRRRRGETFGLRKEQQAIEAQVIGDDGSPLPSLAIHLDRTRNSKADQDEVLYLTGRLVDALNAWLAVAKIGTSSVFQRIDRLGSISLREFDPKAINDIVKQRVAKAGLALKESAAHGLRSAYITEATH